MPLFLLADQPKPAVLRKHSTLSSLFGSQHDPLSSSNATSATSTRLWGRSRRESAGAGKAEVVSGWKEASTTGGGGGGGQVAPRAPPAAASTGAAGRGGYHSSVATSARRIIHGRTDWSAK